MHTPSASTSTAPPARRSFLFWLTGGLGAIASAIVGVPFVGYLAGSRKPAPEWVDLGAIGDFPLDETRMVTFENPLRVAWDGVVAQTGVYVRNEGKDAQQQDRFLVLGINCAHLGCPVTWFPQSGLFMCPCHGGVYYGTGERASGPPPRGLFRCAWRVRNGRLEVESPHYPTLQDPLVKNDTGTA
jgi:menaquinol-cytochrome c reductase iron-sulfur subunit